jgi:membrane-associated protein
MFDQFTRLVTEASLWTYGVIVAFALLDALLPVVPSETVVITAGVVAASGHLALPLIIAAATAGAFLGDNLGYLIGLRFGPRVKARFFDGEKAKKRVDWAEQQLTDRGGELIVAGRFIPGGRTAVTLSAGTLAFPWRRFAAFDIVASVIWAAYATLLGYLGGRVFENAAWKGLLLAFAISLAVAGGIEAVRWYRRRASRARLGPNDEGSP